jgi:hypothetical protein
LTLTWRKSRSQASVPFTDNRFAFDTTPSISRGIRTTIENTSLMPLLTNWVVNQTLREFGLWVKLLPSFQLSIDVTASDLSRGDCAAVLDRAMMRLGVNGTNIEIFAVYMGGTARWSLR